MRGLSMSSPPKAERCPGMIDRLDNGSAHQANGCHCTIQPSVMDHVNDGWERLVQLDRSEWPLCHDILFRQTIDRFPVCPSTVE